MPILAADARRPASGKLQTQSSFFSKTPWAALLGLVAAGLFAFGIWLGITITVTKDGEEVASVDVPDGSEVTISPNGDVEIEVPSSPVASAAGDAKSRVADKRNRGFEELSDQGFLLPVTDTEGIVQPDKASPEEVPAGAKAQAYDGESIVANSVRALLFRQANEYKFEAKTTAGKPVTLSMHEHSLLNWTNPVRGADLGIIVVWKDEGLPLAYGTMFTRGSGTTHSLTSLSEFSLQTTYQGKLTWTLTETLPSYF